VLVDRGLELLRGREHFECSRGGIIQTEGFERVPTCLPAGRHFSRDDVRFLPPAQEPSINNQNNKTQDTKGWSLLLAGDESKLLEELKFGDIEGIIGT
jgi:hypothetical protein